MVQVKIAGLAFLLLLSACSDQFNMRPFWQKIDEERVTANKVLPSLDQNGSLPKDSGATTTVMLSPVDKTYQNLCLSCHGEHGDGKTPAGQALVPHPRDFTDAKWQEKTDDERIAKVIKEGGAAVGLSPSMAPWGALVDDAMIEKLIIKIRAFKKAK